MKKIEIHHGPLHISSLLSIKDIVVKIIIKLAEFHQCLTPSKGLALINLLISEQPIEKEWVEWEKGIQTTKIGQLEKIIRDSS